MQWDYEKWSFGLFAEVGAKVNFAAAKADGISVIGGVSGGYQKGQQIANYDWLWLNPDWDGMVQAAANAKLPIFAFYKPAPALPGFSQPRILLDQLPVAIDSVKFNTIYGMVVNGLLWTDPEGKTPADGNVYTAVAGLCDEMRKHFTQQQKAIPVMARCNDPYVNGGPDGGRIAPSLATYFADDIGYLAHFQYRDKAGALKNFPVAPKQKLTLAEMRDYLATIPEGWENPLHPYGQLLFWEFSTLGHPAVEGPCRWVMFPGTQAALYTAIGFTSDVVIPDPVHECPTGYHWSEEEQACVLDGVTPPANAGYAEIMAKLNEIEALVNGIGDEQIEIKLQVQRIIDAYHGV